MMRDDRFDIMLSQCVKKRNCSEESSFILTRLCCSRSCGGGKSLPFVSVKWCRIYKNVSLKTCLSAHHQHHYHQHVSKYRDPGSAAVAVCGYGFHRDSAGGSIRPRRGLHSSMHRCLQARCGVQSSEVVQGRKAVRSPRPRDQRAPQRHDAVVRRLGASGGAAGRVSRHPPAQRHLWRRRLVHVSPGGTRGRAEPGGQGAPQAERLSRRRSHGKPSDGHLLGCFRHNRADACPRDFPH